MKTHVVKIQNQNLDGVNIPLPISVIPNQMGINLCSVNNITWNVQGDGQLANLSINFIPEPKEEIEEMVTITKEEYEQLQEDSKFLECLNGAGVDNWDGYEYACELYREDNPE